MGEKPPLTDRDLVSKSLQGNELAFRQLIERHHATAYAAVRGVMGDRDDAEDALQQVYIKVFRGLAQFRGDARFSTWLYRIARNEAINAVKKRRLETSPIEAVTIVAPEREGPEAALSRSVAAQEVDAAMDRIDERYREVLELRYMAEQSYEEIAETTGLPVGTVKTYIHRGKAALKKAMVQTLGRRDAASAGE